MVEVIVALAVVALAIGATVAAVSGELAALERGRSGYASASTALRFDDALRAAIAEIRIPFWDRSARPAISGDTVACPYVRGKPALSLKIARAGHTATIDSGGSPRRFPGIESLSARAIVGKDGTVKGLSVSYRIDGVEYTTSQGFGSAALGKSE